MSCALFCKSFRVLNVGMDALLPSWQPEKEHLVLKIGWMSLSKLTAEVGLQVNVASFVMVSDTQEIRLVRRINPQSPMNTLTVTNV